MLRKKKKEKHLALTAAWSTACSMCYLIASAQSIYTGLLWGIQSARLSRSICHIDKKEFFLEEELRCCILLERKLV